MRWPAYRDLREHQRARVEEELQERTAQLLRSERLATIGTLAAGVGHELNNVAAVMTTALSMIRSGASKGTPIDAEDLEALGFVTDHLVRHAGQLLRLGQPQSEEATTFDCRLVVESTLAMLKLAGRTKAVTVKVDMPDAPQWLLGQRVSVEQILVNLIANAVDAISGIGSPGGGKQVTISLRAQNGKIRFVVADDGPGMPDSVRKKMFDPYYTTKPAGYGTGLGLPVVRQIVQSLGGELLVESEHGEGTTMSFEVEASAAPPACVIR